MSVDGFELTFATNHLGPFLLTSLLWSAWTTARIINVASRVHYRGRMDLGHGRSARPLQGHRGLRALEAGQRAAYLRPGAPPVRHGICVNCLHPGVVATNLLPRWLRVVKPLLSRVIFDAERGARTTLYLAL